VSTAATNGKNKGFRDPIHGFITLTPWEQRIIDCQEYQRLRRIRQLALTDMVYPGANHTRFEHSLGVMHVATKMFERIRSVIEELKAPLNQVSRRMTWTRQGSWSDLLPFSMTLDTPHLFADIMENDRENVHGVSAKELCAFLKKNALPAQLLIWRELISLAYRFAPYTGRTDGPPPLETTLDCSPLRQPY
jgi:hypothetical protein